MFWPCAAAVLLFTAPYSTAAGCCQLLFAQWRHSGSIALRQQTSAACGKWAGLRGGARSISAEGAAMRRRKYKDGDASSAAVKTGVDGEGQCWRHVCSRARQEVMRARRGAIRKNMKGMCGLPTPGVGTHGASLRGRDRDPFGRARRWQLSWQEGWRRRQAAHQSNTQGNTGQTGRDEQIGRGRVRKGRQHSQTALMKGILVKVGGTGTRTDGGKARGIQAARGDEKQGQAK